MKKDLRTAILARRLALAPAEVAGKSAVIQAKLWQLPAFRTARVLMAYVACRNEVETEKLIRDALLEGKRVVLPVTDVRRKMICARLISRYPEDLVAGPFGIPEPAAFCPLVAREELDLVLVPGVAYDIKGYRLGYGGGYYDRFLPGLRPNAVTVGLAYDFQVVSTVYPEAHDWPVAFVITEKRVIKSRQGSGR